MRTQLEGARRARRGSCGGAWQPAGCSQPSPTAPTPTPTAALTPARNIEGYVGDRRSGGVHIPDGLLRLTARRCPGAVERHVDHHSRVRIYQRRRNRDAHVQRVVRAGRKLPISWVGSPGLPNLLQGLRERGPAVQVLERVVPERVGVGTVHDRPHAGDLVALGVPHLLFRGVHRDQRAQARAAALGRALHGGSSRRCLTGAQVASAAGTWSAVARK